MRWSRSGALPVDRLPSAALRLSISKKNSELRISDISAALRALPVPVIGRVHDDALWLDLRCLEDEAGFAAQLRAHRLGQGA